MNFNPQTIMWLVLLVPSITLHEVMHGYAAYRLGDPTAKDAGRLTLNPLKHIDPFGTVVLPLLLFFAGMPIFGFAKPVPYNPHYFKNIRRDDLIVGMAGPAANLVLAAFGAGIAWLASVSSAVIPEAIGSFVWLAGYTFVLTNLFLMFFNLIPIPPLDGSSIVLAFLPESAIPTWYRIQRYSFPILIGLLFILPQLTGFDPLHAYFNATVYSIMGWLFGA